MVGCTSEFKTPSECLQHVLEVDIFETQYSRILIYLGIATDVFTCIRGAFNRIE